MKITTFNPQIITKNAEPLVKLFEELGFEKKHNKVDIGEMNVRGIQMINVDDFDEAYQMLIDKGFKNFYGDKLAETPTSKSAVMFSPSGFSVNLVKHIK